MSQPRDRLPPPLVLRCPHAWAWSDLLELLAELGYYRPQSDPAGTAHVCRAVPDGDGYEVVIRRPDLIAALLPELDKIAGLTVLAGRPQPP